MSTHRIYCFWTGDNEMSPTRLENLDQLRRVSECTVLLVTKDTLPAYILPEHPLHPAFDYLSETHKADYLRTYFMNFHGGGYSDIKKTTGSWIDSFDRMNTTDSWICGYKEVEGGVAYPPNADKWREMVGNGAYICKPLTPLTQHWYAEMMALLDSKLDALRLHPSTFPQDCSEVSPYPIAWNELLGRIFHRVSYEYKEHLLPILPISIFNDYR
jgi:hypothetical protein